MMAHRKIRLGDLLVEHGIISQQQLEELLMDQKKSRRKLGHLLVERGMVKEKTLLEFLSRQLDIPLVDLKHHSFKNELTQLLPERHARAFRAVVLDSNDAGILVGMADPTDLFACDELGRLLKAQIQVALVSESDLLAVLDYLYGAAGDISALAVELDQELSQNDILESHEEDLSETPVVRLLHSIFQDAIHSNASDIHIEPDEQVLRIRQRIDGVLREQIMKENKIANALVSRLKLMAGLDIAEKRLPQDGRFHIKIKSRPIDVRLSTMPVQYGESVVMRLLDQSKQILNLDQLGMSADILTVIRRIIHHPNGLLVVTGPTGSGKTTTLYAMLNQLNSEDRKIITVEDPVEYRLPRINQVQVNAKIELSFARVLRSALRQDPDIIMVGEIRDQETVNISVRAAMTGHFVLSTLHTNDAISTANRLMDMGVEGYQVATALRAILAQRLIRRNCEDCTQPYELNDNQRVWLRALLGEEAGHIVHKRGIGCNRCSNTGFKGRIGVYELLEIDEELAEKLRLKDSGAFASAAKARPTFRPFINRALEHVQTGITTVDEVIRISGAMD